MIFKGRARGRPRGARGDPKRTKALQREPKGALGGEKRAPGEPQGTEKELQREPKGAKRSKKGHALYKLTPDQPQSGQYVNQPLDGILFY